MTVGKSLPPISLVGIRCLRINRESSWHRRLLGLEHRSRASHVADLPRVCLRRSPLGKSTVADVAADRPGSLHQVRSLLAQDLLFGHRATSRIHSPRGTCTDFSALDRLDRGGGGGGGVDLWGWRGLWRRTSTAGCSIDRSFPGLRGSVGGSNCCKVGTERGVWPSRHHHSLPRHVSNFRLQNRDSIDQEEEAKEAEEDMEEEEEGGFRVQQGGVQAAGSRTEMGDVEKREGEERRSPLRPDRGRLQSRRRKDLEERRKEVEERRRKKEEEAEQQGRLLFVQKMNPVTGVVEWQTVHLEDKIEGCWDRDADPTQVIARSSYLDMLNDKKRNEDFNRAIQKAVRSGDHVLDIGTGTGLLAMMACRALQQCRPSRKGEIAAHEAQRDTGRGSDVDTVGDGNDLVTACESFPPMATLASRVVSANGMSNQIHIVCKRSDELQVGLGLDMPRKADVLVSEILDSELLGEGLLPTLRHAWEHLLRPGARTVPSRAIIYAQVVESEDLWRLHDLRGVEDILADGVRITKPRGENEGLCGCVVTLAFAMHIDALGDAIRPLTEPFEVFEFDFRCPPWESRRVRRMIRSTSAGTAHAVVSWWVLFLDDDGDVRYSTAARRWMKDETKLEDEHRSDSPTDGDSTWRDHWKQCVHFLPGRGLPVSDGGTLEVSAAHDDLHVWYSLNHSDVPSDVRDHELDHDESDNVLDCASGKDEEVVAATTGSTERMMPVENPCTSPAECSCGIHMLFKPERIAVMGDPLRRKTVRNALKQIKKRQVVRHCVVVDGSVFFSAVKELHDPAMPMTMTVLANSPLDSRDGDRSKVVMEMANYMKSDGLRVKQLGKRAGEVTQADFKNLKVDLVLGEPYYAGCEGGLLWLLRFWHDRSAIAAHLSDNAATLPCKAVLRGAAAYLPDLWRSRMSLSSVEGFDLSAANHLLGACSLSPEPPEGAESTCMIPDSPLLSYSVWQCGSGLQHHMSKRPTRHWCTRRGA
ncbi:hypothetical protein CBR_g41210 [Chara braunii]|uniref:Protein arginine N-methyltransferase domain-containing protein n=1 Tax=Chara braunii TaxID=69332 RepID=A0A388K2K5_CHABU|nr:hypothetical protein CBR_g41210 [Chara braunii]|eukprot:GBG64291.1 hypothetical protein CBR_g41210 [Chara braunii]